jgi:hypothetical protein
MEITSNNFVRTDQMENKSVISLPSSSEPGLAATPNVWLASLAANNAGIRACEKIRPPNAFRRLGAPIRQAGARYDQVHLVAATTWRRKEH